MLLRRTFSFVLLLTSLQLAAQYNVPAPPPTAEEIMRKSLSHWRRNLDAAKNYTYHERSVEEELNGDGSTKKTEIKTNDILIIFGERYEKLIARNDQPLNDKEQEKEEEKLNKHFEKEKNRSDADREKERDKQRDKFQREIADELPRMLNYYVAADTEFNGQPVWVLGATPKPGYHPTSMAGKLLSKLSGKIWITKADYQWVKAEADLADDFTVGWFLFKLHKGTHVEFEQTRVNDEVWLPKRAFVQGSGRIAVKTGLFRNETLYSRYQKFGAESKITGFSEELPAPVTSHPDR